MTPKFSLKLLNILKFYSPPLNLSEVDFRANCWYMCFTHHVCTCVSPTIFHVQQVFPCSVLQMKQFTIWLLVSKKDLIDLIGGADYYFSPLNLQLTIFFKRNLQLTYLTIQITNLLQTNFETTEQSFQCPNYKNPKSTPKTKSKS